MQTIDDVISRIPTPDMLQMRSPEYAGKERCGVSRIALAVESMKRHTSDEGWQIMGGLEHAGYRLYGHNLPYLDTNVDEIVRDTDPSVVVVQDKREWEGLTADRSQDAQMRFLNVEVLRNRPDIFKLTVLKDSHQNPQYHAKSAKQIGCHAWIVYYHPRIVKHLAPYVRENHLIRTYHSLDFDLVPAYSADRQNKALLSGAVSDAYPLRKTIRSHLHFFQRSIDYLPHPGYHRKGCCTPKFLQILSGYKVSLCTSSIYGYALRKIMESVACGCAVITDLPQDDVLPEIDDCLVRIPPTISLSEIRRCVRETFDSYDPEKSAHYAERAKSYYDYRQCGLRLASDIDARQSQYNAEGIRHE